MTVNLPVGGAVRFVVDGWIESADLPKNGLVNTALVAAENELDEANNESSARYQRCSASNLQTDLGETELLPHQCVFSDGYEGTSP